MNHLSLFAINYFVRFLVLTVMSMKMTTVFCSVVPCSLAETDISEDIVMMEAVSTSKTSVNIYQTTQHDIPEDNHVYI
jgi:hypothetical protein